MRGNHVATEPFYVTIEFWASLEGFLSRHNILCRIRVWPRQKGFCVAIGYLMSRQNVAKIKGPCVSTKHFVS